MNTKSEEHIAEVEEKVENKTENEAVHIMDNQTNNILSDDIRYAEINSTEDENEGVDEADGGVELQEQNFEKKAVQKNFSGGLNFDALKEEICSHRISEVVGLFAHLQSEGAGRKKCKCPLHHEKTPSFHLDDNKGLYHCFGCGEGGDIFNFVQKIKSCDFSQALDYLCDIFSIDKSKYRLTSADAKIEEEKKTFYQAMEVVAGYYQQVLSDNPDALNYVKTIRELSGETMQEFSIGLAENDIQKLIGYCKLRDVDEKLLLQCGVIKERQNEANGNESQNENRKAISDKSDDYYLFFRNRIIIPIHNHQGKIVAFGGRVYLSGDSNAKYLNSSDNDYFKKGNVLFNFWRAKKHLGKGNDGKIQKLIIVEGYMDAITLWQNGFQTAIAPLGTSITDTHLRTIFNFCQEPIFVFDSDTAGQKATMRACEMIFPMLRVGLIPKICKLQGAKDVDEFLKKYSKRELQDQFDNAVSINEFVFNEKQQKFAELNKNGLSDPNVFSLLQKEVYSLNKTITDDILRENYKLFFRDEFSKLAQKYHSRAVSNFVKKTTSWYGGKVLQVKASPKYTIDFLEKRIVAYLLYFSDLTKEYGEEIEEQIVSKLSINNQQLLSNLQLDLQLKNDKKENDENEIFSHQNETDIDDTDEELLRKTQQAENRLSAFFKKYIVDIEEKMLISGWSSEQQWRILNELLLQLDFAKLETSVLPNEIKMEERKKLLAKKKKWLLDDGKDR